MVTRTVPEIDNDIELDNGIPPSVEIAVPGCKSFTLYREDMTTLGAWLDLSLEESLDLSRVDFKRGDDYLRYFLKVSGLLDYACAFIYGDPGAGKSVLLHALEYHILRLFPEKRGTIDWQPPKRMVLLTPEGLMYKGDTDDEKDLLDCLKGEDIERGVSIFDLVEEFGVNEMLMRRRVGELQMKGLAKYDTVPEFRRCDRLLDQEIVERLQKETNDIAQQYGDGEIPPQVLEQMLVYNRVFACDECDKWGDKAARTSLTHLMNRLINRRRHYHTTFLFVYVDKEAVDQRLLWNQRTHTIYATKGSGTECEYRVKHLRTQKTHKLRLNPHDYRHLWDSFNISQISPDVKIKLVGEGKKPKKEDKTKASGRQN